jgi:hypothetical protein
MKRCIALLASMILLVLLTGCTLFGGEEGTPAETPVEGGGTSGGDEATAPPDTEATPEPNAIPEPTRAQFGVDECSHAIVDGNCPENCDVIDDIDCCMTEQPGSDGKCPGGWKLVEDRYCFDIAMCDMTYPGFG